MGVQLVTLGRLATVVDGIESSALASQPMRAAVLVWIAIEQVTTREAIAAALWPDRDGQRARHALSQTLYQLRADLGDGLIIAERETLRADPRLDVDALMFARAVDRDDYERAARLYGGPFLAGLHLADSNEFETWVDLQRARLERMNRRSRRQLVSAFLDRGDAGAALQAAREWADLDPFEDEAQHRLIALLAETGRTDDALRRYEDYARILAREDLTPLEETTALIERIRKGEPSAALADPGPAAVRREPPGAEAGVDVKAVPAPGSPSPRKGRFAGATAAVVLLAAAGAVALLRPRGGHDLVDGRILVVPFANETGDSSLTAVGDLAADWIAQGLARSGRLQVVPTLDPLGGFGAGADPAGVRSRPALAVATDAGAALLVSGRFYRRADVLEFYAQITDVGTGELWLALEPVTSPPEEPGLAVEQLGRRVVGSLAARFDTGVPLEDPSVIHPPTFDAFVEYSQGAELFVRGEFEAAITHFLRAATLDTSFVRPLLTAASAWSNLGRSATEDSILEVVARRADALAPYERAHLDWARANLRGDLDAAWTAAQRVAELAPGGPAHYALASLALATGRPRTTLEIFETVPPQPDWAPDWWNGWSRVTGAYHALGEHRRELSQVRRVLRDDARLRTRVLEVRALAALGRIDEALGRLDDAANEPPDGGLDQGELLAQASTELAAHGHTRAARDVRTRAIDWYAAQPSAALTPQRQWRRTRILGLAGRYTEAGSILSTLRATEPGSVEFLGYEGILAAMAGDGDRAAAIDDRLAGLDRPYLNGRNTYWRAAIAAHTARPQAALGLLREAGEQGVALGFDLHADANMEPLWALEEYQTLIVRSR